MHIRHATLAKKFEASNIIHWLLSHHAENILHEWSSVVSWFNPTLRILNGAKGQLKLPQPRSWCVCQQKCSYCNPHRLKVTWIRKLSYYPQPCNSAVFVAILPCTGLYFNKLLHAINAMPSADSVTLFYRPIQSPDFTELPLAMWEQSLPSFGNIFAMPLLHLHKGLYNSIYHQHRMW